MKKIFILLVALLHIGNLHAQTKKQYTGTKNRTKTVKIVSSSGGTVPDSINKQIIAASKKLIKDIDAKMKTSTDTIVNLQAWTSYPSTVLAHTVQVNIAVKGHRTKVKNKFSTTSYAIELQAEQDLYEIHYENSYKKPSVRYNESYWPGFMYNDKSSTPKKKDLNCDISMVMKSIIKNGVKWK